MLSIENPLDPSCSCKNSRLKGDGRAGEELALQGASDLVKPTGLDETQQSHFSIRDYVFTARSKDIGANWPFQQDFLQLCLKHGINDPLPPFEPPDFVRDQRCKKSVRSRHQYTCVDSEKDIVETDPFEKEGSSLLDLQDNCVKHKPSQSLDQSILEYLDQGEKGFCRLSKSLGSNEVGGKGDIVSTLTTEVEINSNPVPADRIYSSLREASSSISEASIEFEALEPPPPSYRTGILIGTTTNECQLIVNLGVVSESSRPEAIIPSSSASSEPMASKVCPVCKTFASTSNTTLNAHIDQCLASESTGKEVLTDRTKYRIKLRKKRLMTDIYATAPHCTLEDLDRRNGTSWAIDSNSPTMNGEMRMEKRQRMGQVDVGDDEHEVYVDSNGTKLRVLSEFNDNVAPTVGDDVTERNHLKMKASKIHFGNAKRFGQKLSKLLKDKPQSKKFRSFKLHNGKILEELHEDCRMDNCEKEKSLSQLLNAQNSSNADGSGAWSKWACSKRSSLSKKSSNRDKRGFAGDRPLIKSNLSTSDNSSTKRNHILKFSRLSEDPTAPLRSKGEEILSSNIDNCERTSPRPHGNNLNRLMDGTSIADGCMMKLPRSSGSHAASPRSKRVEVKAGTTQRSPNPPESHQFSLNAKKSSTLRSNLLLGKPSYPLEQIKSSDNRKSLSLQKSRKGRYVAEMSELIRGVASDVDDGYDWIHDSTGVLRARSVNQNELHSTHKLNCLEDLMGSETEATSTEESMESDKRIESEQDVSTSEQEENEFPERLHFPVEYCGPDMTSGYLEDGCNSNRYNKSEDQKSAAGEVAEKVFRDNIVSIGETQSFNGNAHTDAQAAGLEEDHVGRIFRSKSQVDPATPGSCDDKDKDMNFVDRGGDNAQVATKIEAGSFTEANLTLIHRLGTSFMSPGDTGYEVQELSSVTSSGLHFARGEHQQVGRDQLGSPVSADSAMSPPPTTKSNFKCSGLEAPSLGTEIQNKGSVSFSDSTAEATLTDAPDLCPGSVLPSSPRTEGSEKAKLEEENLEVTVSAVNKSSKFSDDQPCCCSRKESIYWGASMSYPEWQLQIPKGMVSTLVVPPNGGEETTFNSNTRPEICSSFSSGSGSQIDEGVIPSLDSPLGSILTRASSNASTKLQTCSDFSLGSPSSQTPSPSSTCSSILRLMGKDLMVMSKDEDVFVGAPKNPTAAPNDDPNSKYLALFGFPTSNVANQDTISFHGQSPDPCSPPKNFDAFSGGLGSNCKVSNQSPLQLPINHLDMNTAGFMGSAVQQGPEGRSDGQSQQKTLNKVPNFPFSYNIDRSSHHQCPEPVSVSQAAKLMSEVIVIDDSPELGPASGSVDAKYSIGSRGNQPLPMGISPLSVSNFNSRPMNVFSCFPPSSNFSTEQLPVGSNPSFLMSCPGANASFTKQGGSAAEGLGILSPVPPILPSPSTGYLNSTLYYSPSLR